MHPARACRPARVRDNGPVSVKSRIVIVGGGPGGYEAALVASQLGADVTVVEENGPGGAAVLTDVVPSKTLIATAEVLATVGSSGELGIHGLGRVRADLGEVNRRVKDLAQAQSRDITRRLETEGVRIVEGRGVLEGPSRVRVGDQVIEADTLLISTGAAPRELPDARPDGERVLNWTQLYDLEELPEKLVVVGSGVTGAEFASAYHALGAQVALVSSRDRVLPGEDADAAEVLEDVFRRGGMEVLSRSRAQSVKRTDAGVVVTLADGRTVEGSHCLMAVGAVPNTSGLGLEEAGVTVSASGHIGVDRVSRTSARGVYAAGDCTGVFPLASVAAMQGRKAMWHALGDAVSPLELRLVSSNVFTSPEIATVGVTQAQVDAGLEAVSVKLPLATNARAKMQGIHDGFVKLFASPSGRVLGGTVVAPRASELIHPITLAVSARLTVDEVASVFTVYPSISGSVAEAARQLHIG
ncbi:NAD(P)H-quinone dehydrogenase [Kineosporia mesophila]|uniref:NAD(P)H-quinone dehydrogenase n=1 Tax=Kineosporia mesophila TaxID=566012 RepID=A0ABP6ZTG3_9ACTN